MAEVVHEWIDRVANEKWAVTSGKCFINDSEVSISENVSEHVPHPARLELLRLSSQVQSLGQEVERLRELLRGVIAEADRETNAFIEARNALQGSVGETVCGECGGKGTVYRYHVPPRGSKPCPKCQGDSQ